MEGGETSMPKWSGNEAQGAKKQAQKWIGSWNPFMKCRNFDHSFGSESKFLPMNWTYQGQTRIPFEEF